MSSWFGFPAGEENSFAQEGLSKKSSVRRCTRGLDNAVESIVYYPALRWCSGNQSGLRNVGQSIIILSLATRFVTERRLIAVLPEVRTEKKKTTVGALHRVLVLCSRITATTMTDAPKQAAPYPITNMTTLTDAQLRQAITQLSNAANTQYQHYATPAPQSTPAAKGEYAQRVPHPHIQCLVLLTTLFAPPITLSLRR